MNNDESKNNAIKNARWITLHDPSRADAITHKNAWENRISTEDQTALIEDEGGMMILKKSFFARKAKKAVVKASALGCFELWCNGKRVGECTDDGTVYDEMKPGWTDYSKRALVYEYDLLPFLSDGENLLIAELSSGWWCGKIAVNTYGATHPAFICEIELCDASGDRVIISDSSWQGTYGGAIRTSDIWDGEVYDARQIAPEDISADTDLNWKEVVCEYHDVALTEHIGPKIRIRKGLDRLPVSVNIYDADSVTDNGTELGELNQIRCADSGEPFKLSRGEKAVVDLGQNMVGRPDVTIKGERGTHLLIRVGEMLNDSGSIARGNDGAKGSIYSSNYRSAKSKIQYILRGDDRGESYTPHFTFFGFRYLEISADDDVEILSLCCKVIGSETREVGRMETSDPLVNKLISNILWGQRSNYLSVPTDCPQRDERLGWTGDTQAFCTTAAYNADVLGFFRKWLADVRDSQLENGEYTDVVPRVRVVGSGASGWGDAGIIVPYVLWNMYADEELIRDHFASMELYMDWLATTDKKGARPRYGDWLAYEPTDKPLISLAYYVMDAKYMAVMSDAIGKSERAEHYRARASELTEEFRRVYCDENGDLMPCHQTQTAYLLALRLDLLTSTQREGAIKALKSKIIDNGYRLSTGFIGSCIICDTLAQIGENGLAYSLLLQTEDPSWLYSVLQGATTIWERWNSYTKEKGFGNVNMNSFNHYAYGAVQEWMYRHVAGIQTNAPGFARPLIAPKPDVRKESEIPCGQKRITYVKTSFDSPVGEIRTEWDTRDGFRLYVKVPVASTLILPVLTNSDLMSVNGETCVIKREHAGEFDVMKVELEAGEYEYIQK